MAPVDPLEVPQRLILEAHRLVEAEAVDMALEKAHQALETYLSILSRRSGAGPGTLSPPGAGPQIPFQKWHVVNHLKYLESGGNISSELKRAFFKVNDLRNPARHQNEQTERKLVERAIAVVEYAIRSERVAVPATAAPADIEGGPLKLPSLRKKVVARAELGTWVTHGWYEYRNLGARAEIRRGPYRVDQVFEIKVRYLFDRLKFENTIDDVEDFWDRRLGPQVDAYGGAEGTFLVVDCTTKRELGRKNLRYKINDTLRKEKAIRKKIDELFPGLYPTKRFAIFTSGIEPEQSDLDYAKENGISIITEGRIEAWFKYFATLGVGLRYHILRALSGHPMVITDASADPFYHFRAFRTAQDRLPVYYFLCEPEKLLRLSYVYRLGVGEPEGYQRELIRKKLVNINDFLSAPGNYFANNIVLCFDSLAEDPTWPDFEPLSVAGDGGIVGTLHIPKLYCTAEIIDGQHRVYGYLDASETQANEDSLRKRRADDHLSVVAITDPDSKQRANLFVDINSNQTKVNPRQLWAIVASTRPDSRMGYAALIVIGLNSGPVFRNKIHIPKINLASGKKLNIANLGKGLLDRKLIDKDVDGSLFRGDRAGEDYSGADPVEPIRLIEAFFRPFSRPSDVRNFAFSNNGANVILRLLAELARYHHLRDHTVKGSDVRKLALLVRKRLTQLDTWRLLRQASSEGERGAIASQIAQWIRKQPGWATFGET